MPDKIFLHLAEVIHVAITKTGMFVAKCICLMSLTRDFH